MSQPPEVDLTSGITVVNWSMASVDPRGDPRRPPESHSCHWEIASSTDGGTRPLDPSNPAFARLPFSVLPHPQQSDARQGPPEPAVLTSDPDSPRTNRPVSPLSTPPHIDDPLAITHLPANLFSLYSI
jgi:hypothetical protein